MLGRLESGISNDLTQELVLSLPQLINMLDYLFFSVSLIACYCYNKTKLTNFSAHITISLKVTPQKKYIYTYKRLVRKTWSHMYMANKPNYMANKSNEHMYMANKSNEHM